MDVGVQRCIGFMIIEFTHTVERAGRMKIEPPFRLGCQIRYAFVVQQQQVLDNLLFAFVFYLLIKDKVSPLLLLWKGPRCRGVHGKRKRTAEATS